MLNEDEIQGIVDGQVSVNYSDNGIFIIKRQIKYAIEQALLLDSGSPIVLPNSEWMVPDGELR